MRDVITVSPVGEVWQVSAPSAEATLFKSGGRAESCARRLAQGLARHGRPVDVEIYLRDGGLAGRIRYLSAAAPALEPA